MRDSQVADAENFPSTQDIYRLEKIIAEGPPMSPPHTRSLQTFNAKGRATLAHPADAPSLRLIKRFSLECPCCVPGQPSELTHSALLSSASRSGHWGLRGWGKAGPRGGPIPDPVGCSGAPPTTTTTTAQPVSSVLNKTHRARPSVHTQQRLVSVSFP